MMRFFRRRGGGPQYRTGTVTSPDAFLRLHCRIVDSDGLAIAPVHDADGHGLVAVQVAEGTSMATVGLASGDARVLAASLLNAADALDGVTPLVFVPPADGASGGAGAR